MTINDVRMWIIVFVIVVAILVVAALFGWLSGAWAEDYWTSCDEAYKFCAIRPYHRDCSIWTRYGKPLISNHIECPIPNGVR